MSIYLNKDDIQNIDSVATQQKILTAISQYVKEIANTQTSAIEIDIFPTAKEQESNSALFTKNSSFLNLIGSIEGPPDLAENHDHYLKKTKS